MDKLRIGDGRGLILDGIYPRNVLWAYYPFVWTKRSTCGLFLV